MAGAALPIGNRTLYGLSVPFLKTGTMALSGRLPNNPAVSGVLDLRQNDKLLYMSLHERGLSK